MMFKSEEISKVFRETYPHLCRFLESIVGRGRQAQDIAQESFLRLCQAEAGAVPAAEMRFWLFRVARNLALNEVRKGRTRTMFWDRLAGFFYRDEPGPEQLLAEKENRKIVRELLEDLPEHLRSSLLLREEEEMSYREIALVLDVSESKIKVDIFRARKRLRELWLERHLRRRDEGTAGRSDAVS